MSSDDQLMLLSFALLAIGLGTGAVALVLAFKGFQRELRRQIEVGSGTAFNVSSIAPRIENVRKDYLLALQTRPHPRFHPVHLVREARRSLSRFGYFKAVSELANERTAE